ncbi:MAG: tetraacyldisaccharide 4'-kinase [Deltaproteobacteria bacterium]|jgi:tetraacyldisaccharide 4'-kinase|nr:tetraacyldisaccharide 4'-kinase [Deltaproteobacteria bacterium]
MPAPLKALWPLGHLWGWLMGIRRESYESGLLSAYRPLKPVVSIGNLTLGGNAKTPMSIFLANRFSEAGLKAAVLSRGYHRLSNSSEPLIVSNGQGPTIGPLEAGDEPFLIASLTKSIVICAKKRKSAADKAVSLGADVLILDDGFQHLALKRDLDILMMRSENPLGDGLIIPSGLLRERPQTHNRAQIIVAVGSVDSAKIDTLKSIAGSRPLYFAKIKPLGFRDLSSGLLYGPSNLSNPSSPSGYSSLKAWKLAAFCGLANPTSFFNTLRDLKLDPIASLKLPDHALYGPKTLMKLREFLKQSKADYLVTTAKDAVKIRPDIDLPILVLETQLSLDRPMEFFQSIASFLNLKVD